MKNLLTAIFFILLGTTMYGQEEITELRAEKEKLAAEQAELDAKTSEISSRISEIDEKLEILGGWQLGSFGTLGFNQSSFNNWIKGANPDATSSTILATLNGFANKKTPDYFWRNAGGINLGWQKLDTDTGDSADEEGYENVADVFTLSSLYGRNLTEKLALSALGEYNTSIINNINDPGILDLGVGFTWLPIENMVVVVHPLNYHWVFGNNPAFESALGTKVAVDYTNEFPGGITWRSNLTGFLPYKSTDPTLREYTWTNGIAFTAWKGIGVGIEYAVRNAEVESDRTQSYFVMGLSYAL